MNKEDNRDSVQAKHKWVIYTMLERMKDMQAAKLDTRFPHKYWILETANPDSFCQHKKTHSFHHLWEQIME